MNRLLQISNILALGVTILVNYLSNTGFFNNETMASVSGRYSNLFTPAGYAFAIWGVIYLLLTAFVIYQAKGLFGGETRPIVQRVGWLFVLSCLANSLWVICWLYNYTGTSIIVMSILLIALLGIVQRTRMELDVVDFKTVLFEWWPFATYLGWITVALIANAAAYLTKIGWKGFGLSPQFWAVAMIVAGVIINLALIWKRNLRESAGAAAWGLVAVAVANRNDFQVVEIAAACAAGVLLVSMMYHGYLNKGKHFYITWPRKMQM